MNHAILFLLLSALGLGLAACEIHPLGTEAKLRRLQAASYRASRHKKHTAHHAATGGAGAYVSPQWLETYRALEAEHGDYTIPDDHRIQVRSDGKIRVPTTVIRHFDDLSKAPTQPTEPPQ